MSDNVPPRFMSAVSAANLIIREAALQQAMLDGPRLLHMLYMVQGYSMAMYDQPVFRDAIMANVGAILCHIDALTPVLRRSESYDDDGNIRTRIHPAFAGEAGSMQYVYWRSNAPYSEAVEIMLDDLKQSSYQSPTPSQDTLDLIRDITTMCKKYPTQSLYEVLRKRPRSALMRATERYGAGSPVSLDDMREEFLLLLQQQQDAA